MKLRLLILLAGVFLTGKSFALPPCPTSGFWNVLDDCYGSHTYKNGDKYVGEIKDGQPYGLGSYYFLADNESKGGKYVGEFRDGKKHGQGTYTFPNDEKYVGEFRDGKRHEGISYSATDKPVDTYSNGQWCDGCTPTARQLALAQEAQAAVDRYLATLDGAGSTPTPTLAPEPDDVRFAETRQEKDCRSTFENPHRWHNGSPQDRFWDSRCWDFVAKKDGEWEWVGDAETRRIAEEKRQAEEEELRRIAETERKKKEEEERKRREELRELLSDFKEETARYETVITTFLGSTPNPSLDEVETFFSAQSELRETLKAKSSKIKSYGEEVLIPEINYGPLANIYIKQRVDVAFAEDGNLWRALETSFGRLAGYGIPESAVTEFPVDIVFANFNEKDQSGISFPIDLNLENLSGVQTRLGKQLISAGQVPETLEKSFSQYRVLVDLSEQSVDRSVTSQEIVDSQYLVSEELVPNPAYRGAQMRYYEVKEMWDHYNNQQSSCNASKCIIRCCLYCYKMCNLAKEWQGRHQVARRDFLGVKEWIKTPVYQPYQFRQTNISVSKSMTVTAYIVNRDAEVIAKSTKEFSDEKEFAVLYGRHQEDKRKKYLETNFAVESDALNFAEAAISLEVSELLQERFVLKKQSGEFIDVTELVASLSRKYAIEDNVVLENSEAISTEETDKRFESVVVVLHPNGSIGSGFFVTPEIILTNYHVVEGTEFPEIVKFDGLEGTGQIIAKDIRRDLVLVKVDIFGVPVTLASSNKVKRGATVEAIGHPEGLEFSLTRGVVSGVRRLPSLYDPGGSAIRFVQSDVAINPGNSGGPLFEGAYVIGVNDWKLAATELEGLSFAIHISEVRKFLSKNGL